MFSHTSAIDPDSVGREYFHTLNFKDNDIKSNPYKNSIHILNYKKLDYLISAFR